MRKIIKALVKTIPIFSLISPVLLLYYWDPSSFEHTWQGRTFYLFFIWLITLETVLDWERLQVNLAIKKSLREILKIFLFVLAVAAPTVYVIVSHYGLNLWIAEVAKKYVLDCNSNFFKTHSFDYFANILPIPMELLVLTVLFCLIVLLAYGIKNLPVFSGSIFFLGVMGLLFAIDDLYPGGRFTPLQMLVPVTAFFAARLLELFGYAATVTEGYSLIYGRISILKVNKISLFGIGWICAGVESLVIYTIVIFLFLKKSEITTKRKILYFMIGAVVTYFLNILRIFTLAMIRLGGGDIWPFHNFYGQFYSITWITLYPIMIVGVEKILKRKR
ncbi:MAG: exosortase/archaeosortase family protein [Candidatus Bathyarchaeia archaeon]